MKTLENILLKTLNQNSDIDYDTARLITQIVQKELLEEVKQCVTHNQIRELLK